MPSEESHWIAQPSILMQAADALLHGTTTSSGTMAIISLQVLVVVLEPQ